MNPTPYKLNSYLCYESPSVCGALAASARVLRGWEDALADECLATTQNIWLYENTHPVKVARSSYTPGWAEMQAIVAAAEWLMTTEEEVFQQFLVGAAYYIFCVLAANQILAETTPRQN